MAHSVHPRDVLTPLLSNGTTTDMSLADGTVETPDIFKITAVGSPYLLTRVDIYMQDGSIKPTNFLGANALTNGILIRVRDSDSTVRHLYTDGFAIKNHNHFGLLAGIDVELDSGAGDDVIVVRWTLSKAHHNLPLELDAGASFEFVFQDDISSMGITSILAQVQGSIHGSKR